MKGHGFVVVYQEMTASPAAFWAVGIMPYWASIKAFRK